MRKTELRSVPSNVEIERLCNKCGKSCSVEIYEGCTEIYGFSACMSTGYMSPQISSLPDDTFYEFDICEPCAKEFMDSFKIPVDKQ